MKRTIILILASALALSLVTGCFGQRDGSDTEAGGDFSDDDRQALEEINRVLDLIEDISGSTPGNYTAPNGFWLEILSSPAISARASFDEIKSSISSVMPVPESGWSSNRPYAIFDEDAGDGAQDGWLTYGNISFDDFMPGTYKMTLEITVSPVDETRTVWDHFSRRAEIKFERHEGEMQQSEAEALFEYLCGQAESKFAPMHIFGSDRFESGSNSYYGSSWDFLDGDYALFGAHSGGSGRFFMTIGYSGRGRVAVLIDANDLFEYTPPDKVFIDSAYNAAALANILPDLLTIEKDADRGERPERYVLSPYSAMRPDPDGRISARMVLDHEHGADREPDDSVRDADRRYIDDSFAIMNTWAAGFNCWSVGMTPFATDVLSCVKQRQPLSAMTSVTDYAFREFGSADLVREDLTPFQSARDFSRNTTLEGVSWHGVFSDLDAAFNVYNQLVCGFLNFYEGSNYSIYAGGADINSVLLLPYYSNALNMDVINPNRANQDRLYALTISSDYRASNVHPAFNISGVVLELTQSADTGRFVINISFRYNEFYTGFIVPDGSAAIPE